VTSGLRIILVALLWAVPQNAPVSINIEGTVVQADSPGDLPIANAQVQLQKDRSDPVYTRTGSTGLFRFADIPPGQYQLKVIAAGYVAAEYGQHAPGQPGAKITVTSDVRIEPFVFKLVRAATIAGRVQDTNGFPLADVPIEVYRATYSAVGRRVLTPIMFTRTDDRGDYRLYWLTPDEYYVSAAPSAGRQGPAFTPINPNLPADRPGYPGWLYPGVPDLVHAVPIALKAGEIRGAVDFRFMSGTVVNVSGTVIDQRTGTGALSQLTLSPAGDVRGSLLQSLSDTAGKFQFRGVASGSYTVSAYTDSGAQVSKTIEVGDKDLSNLSLFLESGFSITGQVRLSPDDPSMKLPQISMGLIPGGSAQTQADGTFEIKNVRSGSSTVYAWLPDGLYIQSARFGQSDAMTDHLPDPGEIRTGVARSDAPGRIAPMTPGQIIVAPDAKDSLDIVVSSATGSLRGSTLDASGMPFPAARVVLVPEDKLRGIRSYYQVSTSDQNGTFSISGIPPGAYTIFAWSDVTPGAYYNGDFLRNYEDRGVPVQIHSRMESATRVPVISSEGR